MKGVYQEWAIAAQHITGIKGVIHKSYDSLEEAKKAFAESYSEVLKAKPAEQTRQLQNIGRVQRQSIDQLRSIKTREEVIEPTQQKFDDMITKLKGYSEVDTTKGYYLHQRIPTITPKVIVLPKASPALAYEFFTLGLLDTIYTSTGEELRLFPSKMQNMIRQYIKIVAKGNQIFLRFYSSFPIFGDDGKVLIPAISYIMMGSSSEDYPVRDIMSPDWVISQKEQVEAFVLPYNKSRGIYSESMTKVSYYNKRDIIIISKYNKKLSKEDGELLAEFDTPYLCLEGIFTSLPEDFKKEVCTLLQKDEYHLCKLCTLANTATTSSNEEKAEAM